MSNVSPLLPRLTINGAFIDEFLAAPAPCFALGLVEQRKRTSGFLTIRPDDIIPSDVTSAGFRFGHTLLGTSKYAVVHFAFEFYGFGCYNVLVNPKNLIVRAVLTRMVESGEYFFFAINPDGSATAFSDDVGRGGGDIAGLKHNLPRILAARTTDAEYKEALARFQANPSPPGKLLNWVCRDDTACLDLATDRFEIAPAPFRETAMPDDLDELKDTIPEPCWQPLSMLRTVAPVIDGELESTEDLHTLLIDAVDQPHLLDDETVHRTTRLCTNQLEFLPVSREQIARWRAASPSRAQRDELTRLEGQLERHERLLKESLALAKKLAAGTIDAILRVDEGELGLAVLEGKIKPPSGAPLSEDLRLREQRAIAEVLDVLVVELERTGVRDLDLLAHMGRSMSLFKRLVDIAGPDGLSALWDEYHGLRRFAKLLETIAAGIQFGDIKVPR